MLEIKNASKIYGEGKAQVVALDDVSFVVNKGEFIAIMGPSGSGKSTLLNIIGGLDHLSKGKVILDKERIDNLDENALVRLRRRNIAYIFQHFHLLSSLNALENVMLPLIFCGDRGDESKAINLLEKVGLAKRSNHKMGELSGGELQRVAIARALVNNPAYILADEPTGNMDQKTGANILKLFDELSDEGQTIIMVTHDPAVAEHAGRIIFLEDGKIVDIIEKKLNKTLNNTK